MVREPGVSVQRRQGESEAELVRYIRAEAPQSALVLEYVCHTVKPILSALADVNCHARLLLHQPTRIVAEWERERIRANLREVCDIKAAGYDNLVVRSSEASGLLRGRRVGVYVVVGWHVCVRDFSGEADDPEQPGVWGHDNLAIMEDERTEQGALLSEWFEDEFEELWLTRPDEEL